MKIPSTTNLPTRTPESNKTTKRAGAASNASETTGVAPGDDEAAGAPSAAEGRDFASVLEEISRPDRQREQEAESESESLDSTRTEKKTSQEGVERREERRDNDGSRNGGGAGGGFERAYGGVREVAQTSDAAGARAILHIADLERIVSAVRTQILAGGRREITVELRRSVLEGLQVKLSTDGAKGITAEFIAASERVRSQLDARASELADILRSRGLNLSALSTTVSADASGKNFSNNDEPRSSVGASAPALNSPSAPRVEDEAGAAEGGDTATTYRA